MPSSDLTKFKSMIKEFIDSKKLSESQDVIITPHLARFILNEYNYEDNREIRKEHVRELTNHLLNGTMRNHISMPKFAVCGFEKNKVVLVDGNHTVNAIVNAQRSYPTFAVFYNCAMIADLEDLYVSLDRNLPRRLSDFFEAYQLDDATGFYLKKQKQMIISGIRLFQSGLTSYRTERTNQLEKHELVSSVLCWAPEMRMYENLRANAEPTIKRRMRCAPLVATSLLIMRFHPNKGNEFFNKVFSGDNLHAGTPEHALYNYILGSNVRKIGIQPMCSKIALCFKAYYNGDRRRFSAQGPSPAMVVIPDSIFDGTTNHRFNVETLEFEPMSSNR